MTIHRDDQGHMMISKVTIVGGALSETNELHAVWKHRLIRFDIARAGGLLGDFATRRNELRATEVLLDATYMLSSIEMPRTETIDRE